MQFIELFDSDKGTYNQFVMNQPTGSFLQSWEWGEWQAALGREVYRYFLTDNNELITNNNTASIQLVKMLLPFGKYYLYAPYGPVIGSSENQKIGSQIAEELKNKFLDAVFIRLESKDNNLQATDYKLLTKSPNIQPAKTLLIDLLKPEEQLLSEMHNKTRYNIKVAQKHGVEIQDEFVLNIGKGFYFEEAINLIVQTASRQGFGGYGKQYYQRMVDFFALQNHTGDLKIHIYKALYQKHLLTAAIMLDFGNTRTFLFGGSSDLNKNVMAPYLLHWQAMQDAKKQNLSVYDFWGIETSSGEVPGFVRFKLGFGGQEAQYGGAYDYIFNSGQYRIYKLFRLLNKVFKKISS